MWRSCIAAGHKAVQHADPALFSGLLDWVGQARPAWSGPRRRAMAFDRAVVEPLSRTGSMNLTGLLSVLRGAPLVVVTATGREADDLALALRSYLPADDVAVLPAWETLPHERLSPRSDTVARRLAVFRRLAHPEADGGRHHGAGPV